MVRAVVLPRHPDRAELDREFVDEAGQEACGLEAAVFAADLVALSANADEKADLGML